MTVSALGSLERSMERLKLDSKETAPLSAEIWGIVASYLKNADLKNLSEVSLALRCVALKELNARESMASLDLAPLTDIDPLLPGSEYFASIVSCYQYVFFHLSTGPFQDFLSDRSIQEELKPLLTALTTHEAVSEVLSLRLKTYKEIYENKASFESILQNYRALTTSFVKRAIALVQSKAIFPPQLAGLGLQVAAEIGNLDLVQVFYESASISNNHKFFSLYNAALKGHLEIVKYLSTKTTISEERIKILYTDVTSAGQTDVLKFLLKTYPISNELQSIILVKACEHGHFNIVKLLMANGPVYSGTIADCLIRATFNGHHKITRFLMLNNIAENSGCVIC